MYEDTRVKTFSPSFNNFPYTVEYEYEVKTKNSLYFDNWVPQNSTHLSVQQASFSFASKENFRVRTKEFNFHGIKREYNSTKDTRTKVWEIINLPAIKMEANLPSFDLILTKVMVAPIEFKYEGLSGQFSDWKEYGSWIYNSLLRGRDNLPEHTITQINDLIKDAVSEEEKAKLIYEYVQGKTRYVSIQKGIGGIQPMTAMQVDQLGYGDCKALTYYTQSLLKLAGITSHYAEVYAGERIRSVTEDFASLQGNHVILCVPFAEDTIWLECTSQKSPFGYLGSFTDNRYAVLCTENGGIIAKTKAYKDSDNSISYIGLFSVDEYGNLKGKFDASFKGIYYTQREHLLDESNKKRDEVIQKTYRINNLNIDNYSVNQIKTFEPETRETCIISVENFAAKSTNRMFFYLNHFNLFKNNLPSLVSRIQPIWISRGYVLEDHITYSLPEDYKVELLPKSISVVNDFGSFESILKVEGRQLFYRKKVLVREGIYPKEQYSDFFRFFEAIENADSQKIVLIRE